MPTIRCVLCQAKQPQDTVFQFPRHTLSQRRWMSVCNVEEVRPSMGVCVRHFERSEINLSTKVPRLSPGAVPSLYPSEIFEGRLVGNVGISKKLAQLHRMRDSASAALGKPAVQPIPETFKDIRLPIATYTRLMVVKNAMESSSVEKTIERLAVWFLRKESVCEARRTSDDSPPVEDGTPPDAPRRSLVTLPPPAAAPSRNLAETELLQEMDVQLESEDDPASVLGGGSAAGLLCDGAASSPHWGTSSAVIAEPQLTQLLMEAPVRCPACVQSVPPAINRISLSYSVTWVCPLCGIVARPPWHSTSASGQVTTFDAVFAAAVTLSGCAPSAVQRLLDFVNMGRLNCAALHRLNDAVVSPVIAENFADVLEANRAAALAAAGPEGLVVAGNYQLDSPDFSMSFGTYTLMDYTTGLVVAQNTVSHRGPRLPSRREELGAVRRCLEDLRRAEIPIAEFISDRHVGAKRLVARRLPSARYSYDVRDAAAHVEKRLQAYAARPRYKELKCWIDYLKNQFWLCAKLANGSVEQFEKLWSPAADHVVNQHGSPPDGCRHGPLDGPEPGRPWLLPGSPAHRAVRRVVLGRLTRRMAQHVLRFRHESRLEVLRAVDQLYTPKQEACTLNRLVARKRAAVLDYTAHLGRPYVRSGDNGVRHIRAFSRAGGCYLTRPVRVAKAHPHVGPLLARVAERRRGTTIAEQTVLAAAG